MKVKAPYRIEATKKGIRYLLNAAGRRILGIVYDYKGRRVIDSFVPWVPTNRRGPSPNGKPSYYEGTRAAMALSLPGYANFNRA